MNTFLQTEVKVELQINFENDISMVNKSVDILEWFLWLYLLL